MDLPLQHVDVDGVRVAYVETGSGEPIVLLHGYPESHEAWRHQIPELAATHRVIAVDWPGFGSSERSASLSTTYEAESARIGKILDALKLDRVNLIAHDYTGYLALGYLLAQPERIARFAILNSRAHETFNRTGFWATWLAEISSRVAPWLLVRLPMDKFHRIALEPYEQAHCFDAELREHYVGWLGEPAARRWFVKFMSGTSLRARREQLPALAKLDVPTAIIWGDADPWCPNAIADELGATIPNAVVTKIEHGQHFIQEHKPAEVTVAIKALLARPASATTAKAPPVPPAASRRDSTYYRAAMLCGWAWFLCAALMLFGLFGLFVEDLGPVHTNTSHALALNLGVGLLGFSFARFELEHLFVLGCGIGMVVVAAIGFNPGTQEWMYRTFNLTPASSWLELGSGVVSLLLWVGFRPVRRR